MILRALEPEDLDLLYTIENNPAIWLVGHNTSPYSRTRLCDYIMSQQFDIYADKQVRFVIDTCDAAISGAVSPSDAVSPSGAVSPGLSSSSAVGLIDLFNFSPKNMRAEMGIVILDSETGKGYAREAIRLLQDYARNVIHLRQIYAIVSCENEATLHLLRTTGFTREQILADWVHTADGFVDAICLQCLL